MVNEVLAKPRVAAATVVEDFETQAAERPHLGHVVAQLADGVIGFHLDPLGMGLPDVGGKLVRRTEWVVDVRVQLVGVMAVDNVCAGLRHRVHGHDGGVVMEIALRPVRRIERLDRRDQQPEAEFQLLAGLDASRAAESANHHGVRLFGDGSAAFAAIAPRGRNAALAQVGNVPRIFRPLEFALKIGVEIAEPDHIGCAVDLPGPLPMGRPTTAFAAETHHVGSHLAAVRQVETDVLYRGRLLCRERNAKVDIAVELHLC